jgi:hypothetical protein
VRARILSAALVFGVVIAAVVAPAGAAPASLNQRQAVDAALRHVQAQAKTYGLTAADLADVVVTDAYTSEHNGVTHVYLAQRHRGLDVAGSSMTVNVAADGELVHLGNRFVSGLAGLASGSAVLSAADAVHAASSALDLGQVRGLRVLRSSGGPSRATLLSDGGVSTRAIPAKLVYQLTDTGSLRLAWALEIEEPSAEHWWLLAVDAENGKLVSKHDLVVHDTVERNAAAVARPGSQHRHAEESPLETFSQDVAPDGASYRVYAWPLESPNDGPRTVVTSPADQLASPFGWHDTNGAVGPEFTVTRGNNVNAYIDTTNTSDSIPIVNQPDGGPSLRFDHDIDFNTPPTVYKDAAVTNLFYWNNIVHDVFYRYGFTEAAGNFQVNNYSRGGAGNDHVRAEAQDGSGANNANFATPVDGSAPRMQMYLWPHTGTGEFVGKIRDGDLDAGIITHEYGHGISNRLTGGPSNVDCLDNQEQMGEGWSDFLAISLTARDGDKGEQMRGLGTYALYQPGRQSKGIRTTAYSTLKSINPSSYDSIKTAAIPHGIGYVWATMLWEVYWAMVAKHGFNPNVYDDWTTGGNNLAIQLIMDGMKMQACSPGFVDGRDAILAAEQVLTQGANRCEIWAAFAKRGLGYSASQGESDSRSDGKQAFDTHPEC